MKVAKVTRAAPIIGQVKNDIDRVFDRFFTTPLLGETPLPGFPFEQVGTVGGEWSPALDVTETEKEYLIRCEVPGIHKENLDISLSGNVVRITGHKEAVQEGKGETYLYREREVGRFMRALKLPVPIEEGKVEAVYQDGILTVRVPKPAMALSKKVLIK